VRKSIHNVSENHKRSFQYGKTRSEFDSLLRGSVMGGQVPGILKINRHSRRDRDIRTGLQLVTQEAYQPGPVRVGEWNPHKPEALGLLTET
jgi:hypothetical protein